MDLHLKRNLKIRVVYFALLFFHAVGVWGMVFINRDFFAALTPYNLMLTLFMIWWVQPHKDSKFYLFGMVVLLSGFVVELIGVNTSFPFGSYTYGDKLGIKILGVPLIIGVNWLLIMYGVGLLANYLTISNIYIKSLFAAGLATVLDILIEPIAIRLAYWSWHEESAPMQNYVAWFVVSFLLQMVFHKIDFEKKNEVALFLIPVQFLFFLTLNVLI